MHRVGKQNRINIRMGIIDFLMHAYGAGRRLADFLHAALDADKVFFSEIGSVKTERSNQHAAVGQADRIGAMGGCEKAHLIGAVNERNHIAAGSQLLSRAGAGNKIIHLGMEVRLAHTVSVC